MYRISHFCSNCRNAFNEEIPECKVGAKFDCPHCGVSYRITDEDGTVLRLAVDKKSYRYISIPGFGFDSTDIRSGWLPV